LYHFPKDNFLLKEYLFLTTRLTTSRKNDVAVVYLVAIRQAVVYFSGDAFYLVADDAAEVQVAVGGVVMATARLATGKILPSVVSYDAMGQAILNETVEDAIDGYPVHPLLQFGRDAIVAQGIGLPL